MKHLKLLIFTKDENLGEVLKECLKTERYNAETFSDPEEAYEEFCTAGFDLCILDLSAGKEEITLAHAFKLSQEDIRLIFLVNQPTREEITTIFQAGADDMMRKPISLEILQARINAIMGRYYPYQPKQTIIYKFGIFTFNTHIQTLTAGEVETKLTTKESELLTVLCQHANQLVDRTFVLQKIWKSDSYFNARSMDVYITKLRHRLAADPTISIENIHGKGYKLVTQSR